MDPILVCYYSLISQKITKRWIINPSTDMPKYVNTSPAEIEAIFASKRKGGFDDLFENVDFDAPLEEVVENIAPRAVSAILPPATIVPSDTPENVKGITVYEYDKIYEVALKISLITGIPYYRLHIDYIDETGHPTGTYKLFAGGTYDCGLMTYTPDNGMVRVADGVYADKYLYDIRADMRVFVTDTFKIIRGVRYILITDMNEVTTRMMFNDKYTTELTYYGFIMKYFPSITLEVFNEYLRSESAISHKFPELSPAPNILKGRFAAESAVIKAVAREGNHRDIMTSISRCLVSITAPGPLNLRGIFDSITTTGKTNKGPYIPEVHYFLKEGPTTTMFSKVHHGIKVKPLPNQQILKQGVTVVIAEGTKDNTYISFNSNGKIYVKMTLAEEDFVTFEDIPKIVRGHVSDIITKINSLGRRVSLGGKISISDMKYESISANLFWKRILTESQFKELIKSFEKYITAGIIGHYDVINLAKDSFAFMFKKGTYEFDGTLINRVLVKAGKGDVPNQFAYLTNPVIRAKWLEMYSGRAINVTHRASDIAIEILDAQSTEFELFRSIAVNMLSSSGVSSSNSLTVKNALSKSKEQDPVLFNLKKAGYPVVYARICQKKMQPVVYQEDEYNALSDAAKKKLNATKYHNFTYNRPAYYTCPGTQYKHLNFIAGIHPAGYCLPCCFKTSVADKERKARLIYESCTKTFHGPDDLISDSRHILATNKTLDPGRIGHIPDEAKKITPRDSYMFGVPQYYKGTFCPLLYIAAMAVYEGKIDDGKIVINGKAIRSNTNRDMITPFIDTLYKRLKKTGKIYMPDIRPELIIESFSGGLFNEMDWDDVIIRALNVFWGISVIFIEDMDVDLPARGSLSNKILLVAKRVYSKESSVNNAGPAWYPIVQISEEYYKTGEILRVIFDAFADLGTLTGAVEVYDKADDSRANKIPSATSIISFCNGEYTKYIGRGNKVYAIHMSTGRFAGLKIPVPYDDYASGRERVSFDPIIFDTPPELLKEFIDSYDVPGYVMFLPTHVLKMGSSYIGVVINDLHYQHTPTGTSPFVQSSWNLDERVLHITTPPDVTIKNLLSGPKGIDIADVSHGLYKYYVYDLVLMQVVEEIKKARDVAIHDRIREAFSAMKGKGDIPRILKSLSDIIPRGSPDFDIIISALESSQPIDTCVLSYDDAAAEKLITPEGIMNAINSSCTRGRLTIKDFPNVYEACSSQKGMGYCDGGGKLIVDVSDDYWATLPSLVYEDLSNPIKKPYLMDRLYYDNIIDEYSYSVADDESLFIRQR